MSSKIKPEQAALIKPTKYLTAFKRLSPDVSLYEPASDLKPAADSPTTILFCAWMNARVKHIDYYARTYMKRYPGARIVIATITTNQFMFQTEARRRADMIPAVSAILSPDQTSERLFVHTISNGGAKRLYGIAWQYRVVTGRPLSNIAALVDCAPGFPQFRRDMHALMMPARSLNWFLWTPIYISMLVVVSFVYISVNWLPKWFWKQLVWEPTRQWNNPQFMDSRGVRGYVYSKEDRAIDFRHVEAHAKAAKEQGYTVSTKLIEAAGHATLFKGKGGEADYWEYIAELIRQGLATK